MTLNEEEEHKFKEEVKAMEPKEGEKIMEVITSYERKGIELGRKEGIEQGIEQGIALVAKRMLEQGKEVEEVVIFTGLSTDKIERLKEVEIARG
ncbi:transposase [Bacillus alkalicola]|uniref:transposase n=1 Tax=Evansella alkalicola TaxID=745819 RepID=UPI001FE31C41|nr:transposase [Bacillus alkalicola]